MSYLEVGKGRFNWLPAVAGASIRRIAGCVQCGSGLEISALDPGNHSGKCFNCQTYVADDDDTHEEPLED